MQVPRKVSILHGRYSRGVQPFMTCSETFERRGKLSSVIHQAGTVNGHEEGELSANDQIPILSEMNENIPIGWRSALGVHLLFKAEASRCLWRSSKYRDTCHRHDNAGVRSINGYEPVILS